jgi:hypothetical protein
MWATPTGQHLRDLLACVHRTLHVAACRHERLYKVTRSALPWPQPCSPCNTLKLSAKGCISSCTALSAAAKRPTRSDSNACELLCAPRASVSEVALQRASATRPIPCARLAGWRVSPRVSTGVAHFKASRRLSSPEVRLDAVAQASAQCDGLEGDETALGRRLCGAPTWTSDDS